MGEMGITRNRLRPYRLLTTLVTFVCVASAVAFVAWQLNLPLIFTNTTTAGGDTGAHVMLPAFLEHQLLAHGRLVGWNPQWYDGFPFPTFYFPLPDLFVVAANQITNYNVAFKLITIAGSLSLPLVAWAFGRLSSLERPAPELMALASVAYLFNTSYTIDGGNLASTLAGEYDFSLSLSFALLFLGVVALGLRTRKHRALAASLLAATALCHILPAMFAGLGATIAVMQGPGKRRLFWAVPVAITAIAITAYWSIPFVVRLPLSTSMGWVKVTTYLHTLVPGNFQWVVGFAIAGSLAAFIGRHPAGRQLFVLTAVFGAGFVLAPQGQLYNARFLPFWFLGVYLLAAFGLAELLRFVNRSWDLLIWVAKGARGLPPILLQGHQMSDASQPAGLWAPAERQASSESGYQSVSVHPRVPGSSLETSPSHIPQARAVRHGRCAMSSVVMPLVLTLVTLVAVAAPLGLPSWSPVSTVQSSFLPSWVKWNYSGYQKKQAWPAYHSLVQTMAKVGKTDGCGRAMWEYTPQLNDFGTPMALMLLPYWTHGCIDSMEGLLFESSATTPYHFINQAELSAQPSDAMVGLPYSSLNVAAGVRHLQQLGVRYYMAVSQAAQQQANADPNLRKLATSGPWKTTANGKQVTLTWVVYRVLHSQIVVPLAYQPVVVRGNHSARKAWLKLGLAWYLHPSMQEIQYAGSGPPSWKRVSLTSTSVPKTVESPAHISSVHQTPESLSFQTTKIGVPVLVKVSYFPNWQLSGASGPWRVAPNLMVVVPTSHKVTLTYGWSKVGIVGAVLTVAGLIGALLLFYWELRQRRRLTRSESAD